jgi:hypothetical protein
MNATHIGAKLIAAEPMTRQAYIAFRGWEVPADENTNDEGYLVEYADGGPANVPGREGYVSWSPKGVFERSYRPTAGLTFGLAVEALRMGKKVARAGWNGKGMWLRITCEDDATALPWVGMKTADNKFVPWLASQTDILAEDWQIID